MDLHEQSRRLIHEPMYGTLANQHAPLKAAPPNDCPSRIRDMVGNIEERLLALHESLVALQSRIETILVPAAPTTTSTSQGIMASGSDLHQRLATIRSAIDASVDHLAELQRRVEL